MLAAVPAPMARMVMLMSRYQPTLAFTAALSCIAEDCATAMFAVGPNLNRSVRVPGVVTMLEIRPEAVRWRRFPIRFRYPDGRKIFDTAGRREPSPVAVTAVPSD